MPMLGPGWIWHGAQMPLVQEAMWETGPKQSGMLKRHLRVHCTNYTTISMRNFLKSCKR